MKGLLKSVFVSACLLFSGCVNLYVRCPGTSSKITTVYQSTQAAAALSYVVMFPQVMASGGHDAFIPENIISIPCGLVCMCDVPFEAVVDTVCLPYDMVVSRKKDEDFRVIK